MLIFTNKYVVELKRSAFLYLSVMLSVLACCKQGRNGGDATTVAEWNLETQDGLPVRTVAVDTFEISNPFVLYERKSNRYYMTGDGGGMWVSENMREWTGPYSVLLTGKDVWYSEDCTITAPEIHKYNGGYYYLASFEKNTPENGFVRSCALLVSDNITGPYVPVGGDKPLLATEDAAGHPTFCVDEQGDCFIIYSDSNVQGGAIKIILLASDKQSRLGEAYTMFGENPLPFAGKDEQVSVDAPFMFITDEGSAGMLFTAHQGEKSVIAAAYTTNEMGHWLNGPWVPEDVFLFGENVGSASLFTDYDGTLVMTVNKDTVLAGRNVKVPAFVKMDSQFEKLKKIGQYIF